MNQRDFKGRVVVEAPASSANLGPGFDVFALALKRPVDRLVVSSERSSKTEVKLVVRGGVAVPKRPAENVASAVASAIAREHNIRARLGLTLRKGVPPGVGLGSSAASSAAAAVAMDQLHGLNLSTKELISYAAKGEELASGTKHYDNVSAAIVGGFVLVSAQEELRTIGLEAPSSLRLCIIIPRVKLPQRKTEFARSLLPRKVGLGKTTQNVSMASTIVAGFALGDIEMIGQGMQDEIVQPARARMVPHFDAVRRAALGAGASGVCISGAGPAMLAVTDVRKVRPKLVLNAMMAALELHRVKSSGFVTEPGSGARVVAN